MIKKPELQRIVGPEIARSTSNRPSRMNILLIGSYNGQDSLGDKCLLRCVTERFRYVFEINVNFLSHIHNNIEESKREFPQLTMLERNSADKETEAWYKAIRDKSK